MALQHCWRKGYKKIIIESDCKQAIDILNGKVLHFACYNWKREIKWWADKIEDVSFTWVYRKANRVADVLAKKRTSTMPSFCFYYYVPTCITNLLHEDYVQG